jgi:uncharacterized protein YndB with AHSA1/START domain
VDEARCIKVSRRIDAPARRIFALLADPAQHEVIDGSGTVRSADSPQLLTAEGQRFRMHMHREDRGGGYTTDNIVTTFRPDRALGWATTYPDQEPLGYTHTYLLEPDADDWTAVTQVYDWSGVTDPDLLHLFPRISADELAMTLTRLAEALS